MPGVPNYSPPIFHAIDATPTRVSTTAAGQQTIYSSYGITFSPDGASAAFFGDAVNLVDGDTNNCRDVFVKSLVTGAVTRISTNAAGVQGNQDSVSPAFLPGGDKIALISWANNLVAGDTNGLPDIFIKDLATGAITRASTFTDGSQFTVPEIYSTTGISAPEFSPDGTRMAFTFQSAGATVYIKDLITGTLTVAVEGSFAEGAAKPGAQFSPDGTQLLYRQYAPGESIPGLYIKDLASGAVTLVSTNAAGDPANSPSEGARFSPDGTRIVFISGADNLVAGQTGGVFVKDLVSGAVTLVAVHGHAPTFSPDGTKVAFAGGSSLTPGGSNPFGDIYVKDLLTGELSRVSLRSDGNPGYGVFELPVFSPDGLSVGFYGDELVEPDTNGSFEVYMARLNLPAAYVEGGPAVQIVPVAKALDLGSPNYDTGSLTVAIAEGGIAGDQLTLALSSAPGESIALSGDQLFVNGVMVGTLGGNETILVISFNANAKNLAVELLTEAMRISSTSDDPTAAVRTITFTLVDGGGTEDGADDTTSFTRKVAFLPLDPGQNIVGTPDADSLTGGSGGDFIDGLAGADTMTGHAGDDVYVVDDAGDVVREALGGGFDQVYASTGYSLRSGAHVEVVAASNPASTAALNFAGNELGQTIFGNAGANVLTGAGGADALHGRAGDDTYSADSLDVVVEAAGEGFDQVYSLTSFTLNAGAEVEVIAAGDPASTAALNLYGNEYGQSIIGNAGANTLVGGGGADGLYGLAGNDIYSADGNDVVVENAGQGFDQVYALASFALNAGAEIEVIAAGDAASTAALNLIGNEFGQQMFGNAGANVLTAGGGADALYGRGGDDIYSVDGEDAVIESAGQGFDQVYSSAGFTLAAGASIEVLAAGDSASAAALDLIGNEFAQQMFGNAGANILDGRGGADVLYGLGGADTFAFTTALSAGNIDAIADFSAADSIALENAVFTGLPAGALSANAFRVGAAAADADDRIVYNQATGQLFFDADGNGAGAAVQFATLATGLGLTANDFLVI